MNEGAFPGVDGFTIRRVIGSGGFSTVYEAIQDDIGSSVALKVLNVSIHGETGARRLEREYRSMGRLRDQPGIVPVYGTARTSDGHAVIVMGYMPNGSLHDRILKNGPLPVDDVVRIADELATALTNSHTIGIQHRDIKPENVLFDARDNAALSDFGLATLEGMRDASQTAASLSPPHAPPERFLGVSNPDPVAGDIYSLASTLATCITGRPPFGTSDQGGIVGLITRVCNDPTPAFERPGMPRGLTDAIRLGLSKDPADRPANAGAFRSAATHDDSPRTEDAAITPTEDATVTHAPTQAESAPEKVETATRSGSDATRSGVTRTISESETLVIAPPTPDKKRKNRHAVWIAAIAALVILIAGGAFALRSQKNSTPEAPATPVRQVTPTTMPVTVAGGNGDGSGPNQLSAPFGVAIDGKGNLYITDSSNYRVQKWTPGATSGTTVAGGNGDGSGPNQLSGPYGVAIDGKGNLYITDSSNYRVQKWSLP